MNAKNRGGKSKGRFFSLTVRLLHTGERFPIKKVANDLKIRELKSLVEFASGIPCHMQILSYLDEGDLQDQTDVRYNDIVPGATLELKVWHMWQALVEATATKDLDWLMRLGVTKDTDYKTPNSEYMMPRMKQRWIAERAAVALYIAAHRGYVDLCQTLIEAGADVNAQTNLGRTALHVAAAQGRGSMIDMLLEKGADINQMDDEGNSALAIADKFGHKDCERHLFLFRWQERAKQTNSNFERERMAHQYNDSAFPVWLKGSKSQIYYVNILPPGEFEGSMFHSPLRRPRPGTASSVVNYQQDDEEVGSDEENFDEFRRRNTELGEEETMEAYRTYRNNLRDKRVKMPPIAEHSTSDTACHRAGQHKKVGFRKGTDNKDKAKSFEEWLRRKEFDDKKKLEEKKLEKERKKEEKEAKRRMIEQRIAARNKAKGKKDTGNDSDSGEFETENLQSSWINQTANHMLLFT